MGFDLIREFDGGGMGVVYEAWDRVAECTVAIKFLRGVANSAAVDRFLVEVRVLAELKHPNIVQVLPGGHDFYRSDPYFIMEFVPGGTLGELVKNRGPLPPVEAATLIRAVADALRAAHANDVLHRDIKPNNILLDTDGRPKVSDFGLAKRTDKDDGITQGSGALGTPSYMPPEQISKKWGHLGPASDVYGLGATLYFLLTGQPPYKGEDNNDTMNRVVRDPLTRPRAFRPEIPLALEAVAVKCLEKKPADRYATVEALIASLDKFLAAEDDRDTPKLTRLRRARRWVGRHRVPVAAVAVTVLLAVAINSLVPEAPLTPEKIRQKLRAGVTMPLLQPKGDPWWAEWPLGPASSEHPPGILPESGVFSFPSNNAKIVLLLDDPGVDRYMLSADIKQAVKAGDVSPEQNNKNIDSVGLVFSYSWQPAANDRRVSSLVLLGFTDYDAPPEAHARQKKVTLSHVAIVESPLTAQGIQEIRTINAPFDPPQDTNRPWRRIGAYVTPDGIRPFGGNTDFKPSRIATATEIVSHRDSLLGILANTIAAPVDPLPAWSPRMPVGIWCSGSWVSVKNVTIEPLP